MTVTVGDRRLLLQCIAIVGGCSLVGLFSGLWWFFDLFNHFRPQALLASTIFFLLSLLIKDKKCAILSFAVIALNSALMIERVYAFPAVSNLHQASSVEGKTQNISLLFSNVLTSNSLHQSLLDTISHYKTDIVITIEVDKKWKKVLEEIKPAYAYSAAFPRQDNFGMAVYSKLPFEDVRYPAGNQRLPLMVIDFDSFVVIAVHPLPPVNKKNTAELHAYIKTVADIVRDTKKPIVLVGDFNATIWSETVNHLRGLNLMRTNQFGFAWTWPTGFWPFAVQIDHVFVRDVVMADFEVLSDIGSDHFPIKTAFIIQTR